MRFPTTDPIFWRLHQRSHALMRSAAWSTAPQLLLRSWREARTDAEAHLLGYRQLRDWMAEAGVADVAGLEVLDIGCGERAPVSLLLAMDGAQVHAIDILPVRLGRQRPLMWLALVGRRNFRRAIRTVVHDFVHTFRYWRHLGRLADRDLPFKRVSLKVADASRLPYRDNTFDLICSASVWEHLPDIATATREVNRCLKAGGLASIHVALYPSLQGGHQGEWHSVRLDQRRRIRPWDHLYADHLPPPVYLNEHREADYKRTFERELSIIAWREAELEGQGHLSDRVRRELDRYSERDLLLPWIAVLATKRTQA